MKIWTAIRWNNDQGKIDNDLIVIKSFINKKFAAKWAVGILDSIVNDFNNIEDDSNVHMIVTEKYINIMVEEDNDSSQWWGFYIKETELEGSDEGTNKG